MPKQSNVRGFASYDVEHLIRRHVDTQVQQFLQGINNIENSSQRSEVSLVQRGGEEMNTVLGRQ